MNRLFTLLTIVILVSFTTLGQRPTISLTFSAKNNSEWVQLDSIKIMNRTQSVDTVLFYPDTVLTLDYIVGVTAPPDESGTFQVFQNYPNPALDHTMITMYVPLQDEVVITVTDILGRVIIRS